jgi:hypothetical protein
LDSACKIVNVGRQSPANESQQQQTISSSGSSSGRATKVAQGMKQPFGHGRVSEHLDPMQVSRWLSSSGVTELLMINLQKHGNEAFFMT